MKSVTTNIVFFSLLFFSLHLLAFASNKLSLEDYLAQVEKQNHALLGANEASRGASLRAEESHLLYSPNLFVDTLWINDQSPTWSFFSRSKQLNTDYRLGISQTTSFGLQAKVYYDISRIQVRGAASPTFFPENGNYYDTKPYLELTQSLWRNGFGRETRAQVEAGNAAALATSHAEKFRAMLVRSDAEIAYWRLVAALEIVDVQESSRVRAEKILSWQERRAKLGLTDRSDYLQADAAYQLRKLELKTANDEARSAARAFNLARGLDSDKVTEDLEEFQRKNMLRETLPKRAELREDVHAAGEQSRAAQANARANIQKQNPTLEIFSSFNLTGRDPRLNPSMQESFTDKYPTATIGLRFRTPLNFGQLSDNRAGYHSEIAAADYNYQRKLIEQDSDWKELSLRLREAQSRMELAHKIELAQKEKVLHERKRQDRGRTTMYQVLVFEQDYAQSQIASIRAALDVQNILAQLKTFGGNP